MSAPTKQVLNLLSRAARAAADGQAALTELQAYLYSAAVSPSTAGVAAADYTALSPNGGPAAGVFANFNPAVFASFGAAAQAVAAAVGGPVPGTTTGQTVAQAFAGMAEWAS